MNPHRKLLLLLFFMLWLPAGLLAATVTVRIQVAGSDNRPVPFATVTVAPADSSGTSMAAIADTAAVAVFELASPGSYLVHITSVEHKPLSELIQVTDSSREFLLVMEPSGKSLDEVVVQGKKIFMRQDGDKTIIDPESLAAASTNGYEVLEKTPGVFVDQDGNIYLSSITPATVYINGREMKMSRTDVATMLKNLPPNSIERIEILRTPSARYDASGSGGVVNVVLKKGVRIGFTGSLTGGFQQGTYGNQLAGINLSNNDGDLSTYINLNYTRRNSYEATRTQRQLVADTFLDQEAYTTYPGNAYYLGYGVSKDLDTSLSLSYDGRLSYNNSFNATSNANLFTRGGNQEIWGTDHTDLQNDSRNFLLNQDIAVRYKLDTAGSEWTADLSYMYSSVAGDQAFNAVSVIPYSGGGQADSRRHFFSGQTDFIYKLTHHISLEAGLKSTYMTFDNATNYFLSYNNQTVQDNNRTSTYRYRENINAAYAQASKGFGDIILKAGVRMENTNMDGHQLLPGDTSFRVNRTDFFPYIYLSKKVMTIAKFDLRAYLVYRKTITRPSYEQLNPFPKYLDQFLSETGNPTLRPQFTHTYEANVSVDERPLIAIGINDTRDLFTNVYYQADSSRAQAYRTYDNIGKNREFYLRGLGAIPPGGVYFFVFGGQYNYNIYEGLYEGKPLSFRKGGFLFFTYHQLKLGARSLLTLSGFLRLKGPLQFYELNSFGALNLNVNRRFFKEKLTVTLSANDIFFTNKTEFTLRQGSVNAAGSRESDSRRFGISFRYNFGFHKKDEEKDMFLMQPDKVN